MERTREPERERERETDDLDEAQRSQTTPLPLSPPPQFNWFCTQQAPLEQLLASKLGRLDSKVGSNDIAASNVYKNEIFS